MAIAMLVVMSRSVFAQAAPAETGEYRALIAEALREYDLSHWEEAEALFQRAHALNPNARTLRGMGLTAFESRRYVRALSYLKAALTEPRNALTAAQQNAVQGVIERASTFVARFELSVRPADARLSLNGAPVQPSESGEILLDPGDYDVVATAEGYMPASTRISAVSGASGRVVLELVPRDAVAATTAVPQAPEVSGAVVEGQPAATRQPAHGLTWTWVAAGAVPVFAGAAAVVWFTGQAKLSEIESKCGAQGGCDKAEAARRIDDAGLHTHQTATTVLLSLTGAAAVSAAVLFFVEGGFGGEEKPPASGVAIGPRGLVAWSRF